MITEYHRPATLDEAVALIATPGAQVIVEGASLAASTRTDADVVVDLQSLDLDGIVGSDEVVQIGSMVTLATLATSTLVPPIIADLARREEPSSIRTMATVGGVIATNDAESELLAGLVAYNASMTVARADATEVHPLETVLVDPRVTEGSIIIDISIETRGIAAAHRTGRTPMDRPIVLVVGHKGPDGHIRLAVTGVEEYVVAVSPGQTGELDPPSDFRGTSEYRASLVNVLTKRVLADLSKGGAR